VSLSIVSKFPYSGSKQKATAANAPLIDKKEQQPYCTLSHASEIIEKLPNSCDRKLILEFAPLILLKVNGSQLLITAEQHHSMKELIAQQLLLLLLFTKAWH
jgi:hypothetical protein